jgi:hypothetical protein
LRHQSSTEGNAVPVVILELERLQTNTEILLEHALRYNAENIAQNIVLLNSELIQSVYENSYRTAQRTRACITETNWLKLFVAVTAVYCAHHINTN